MMSSVRILIVGGAGMLGAKLASRLAQDGALGATGISQMSLVDVAPSVPPSGASFAVETQVTDISERGAAAQALATRPDVIFHLAAVVSGEAEADLDKGYRVNVDGTRRLLDAIREVGSGYRPRVVFASSIAVFGPPFPDAIGDEFAPAPLTSYGTQKAIDELLLADYSRRGLIDGIAIRLPTICVRPGAPNRAASGFFSNIIREPLNGREAVLPVSEDVRHWFASPRAAVGFLVRAATLEASVLAERRSLTMPGVSATVAEQIAALREVGGEEAVRLIRREPDRTIMRIVESWPRKFEPRRAHELGFRAETSFDEIIRIYLEDDR
jgi:nucleoside-diphosphate-sugar epimerase